VAIQSPLLSSHLYYKVTVFLSWHRRFHMNWISFKRSTVLKDHFFFCPKGDLLIQVWLYNILRKRCSYSSLCVTCDAQQPWCLYYLVLPVHSDKLFLARRNHLTRFMLTYRAVLMLQLLSGRRQNTTRACLTDTTILILKTQQQWNCLEICTKILSYQPGKYFNACLKFLFTMSS